MGVSFNIKEKKEEEFHLPTALFFVACDKKNTALIIKIEIKYVN